jgi:hypothetical protein
MAELRKLLRGCQKEALEHVIEAILEVVLLEGEGRIRVGEEAWAERGCEGEEIGV